MQVHAVDCSEWLKRVKREKWLKMAERIEPWLLRVIGAIVKCCGC